MTTFQQLITAAQFQVTGGSPYQWESFGPDARFLDFDSPTFEVDFNLIFDTKDQEVYQASLYVGTSAFRWTHPDFIDNFKQEAYARDVDPRVAYDDTFFTECDVFEDFIEKVEQAFTTGVCDTSVLINIDFTPEQEELFAQLPQGTDVQQFILQALQEKIALMSKQHSDNWDIIFSALNESDITASINDDSSPIADGNIQDVYNWLNSLQLKNVDIFYSDKETAKGLISILTVYQDNAPDLTFEYKYQKK